MDRLFLVPVPDSTTEAIENFFDFVDRGVEAADRVLNRSKRVAERHHARHSARGVIEAEATPVTVKKSTTATAIVRKPHFYIVEAVGPAGATLFVVTDGGNARTECSSREFALKVLRALEASS